MSRVLSMNANNQTVKKNPHQSCDSLFSFPPAYMYEKEMKIILRCVHMCACVFSFLSTHIISLVKFFHAKFHYPCICMHLCVVKTIYRHIYVHTLKIIFIYFLNFPLRGMDYKTVGLR